MRIVLCAALGCGLLVSAAIGQVQPGPQRGRLPPGFPGRPGMTPPGQPAMPVDPLTAPPRPTSAAPLDLSGSWKGVYVGDDVVIHAELVLTTDAAKRTLTGELRYTASPPPGSRRAQPGAQGTSKVTGVVDPGTRAVTLAVAGAMKPSPSPLFAPPPGAQTRLIAVYSVEREELAGQIQSPYASKADAPFFVFARGQGAKGIDQIADHVAAALPGGHPPFKPSGSVPGDEAITTWASKLNDEYGASANAGIDDAVFVRALHLFGDAAFKPVFGESYDAIDHGRLVKLAQKLGGIRACAYFQYSVAPSGPRVLAVAAARTIDAWESGMLAHFRNDPAVDSSFDDLAATASVIKERVPYAWPSEGKAMGGTLEELRTRLAAGALAASVDKTLGDASGMLGAQALASWARNNETMLRHCGPADREAAQQKIDAKLDSLLDQLLAEPLSRIDALGTRGSALRDGAAWYSDLAKRFAFALSRPPVQRAIARLMVRREKDYAAALESILQRISAAPTTQALDAIFQPDLSVPGDPSLKPYAPIAEAAKKRRLEIDHAFQMTLFSKQEHEWMDPPESGHINVKKFEGSAPDAESIRLAVLRGMAFGTGKMIDAHTARSVTRTNGSFLLPFAAIIKMSDEHLEAFRPVEGTHDFECKYTVVLQMAIADDNLLASYDAVVRKGMEQQMEMMNKLLKGAASIPHIHTLRLYEDGWGVPELRDVGTAESVIDGFLKQR